MSRALWLQRFVSAPQLSQPPATRRESARAASEGRRDRAGVDNFRLGTFDGEKVNSPRPRRQRPLRPGLSVGPERWTVQPRFFIFDHVCDDDDDDDTCVSASTFDVTSATSASALTTTRRSTLHS